MRLNSFIFLNSNYNNSYHHTILLYTIFLWRSHLPYEVDSHYFAHISDEENGANKVNLSIVIHSTYIYWARIMWQALLTAFNDSKEKFPFLRELVFYWDRRTTNK